VPDYRYVLRSGNPSTESGDWIYYSNLRLLAVQRDVHAAAYLLSHSFDKYGRHVVSPAQIYMRERRISHIRPIIIEWAYAFAVAKDAI
jgi:hypothetical protein